MPLIWHHAEGVSCIIFPILLLEPSKRIVRFSWAVAPSPTRSLSVVVDSTFIHALARLWAAPKLTPSVCLSVCHHLSPTLLTRSPPQALGAGSSGQPSPLLTGDLCLHRGGGEAAGGGADPQPGEAAGAHSGDVLTCGCVHCSRRAVSRHPSSCCPCLEAMANVFFFLFTARLHTRAPLASSRQAWKMSSDDRSVSCCRSVSVE